MIKVLLLWHQNVSMKIMYIKKIDLDLESTFELHLYWTKFSKHMNTCIAMIHMALACMKHVILTTVWFSLSDNFSLFSLICLFRDIDIWPSDCSAVLLNCVGLFLMVTTACLVGITVFAFYAMKGCDPYTSKEIQNTNQVGAIPEIIYRIGTDQCVNRIAELKLTMSL